MELRKASDRFVYPRFALFLTILTSLLLVVALPEPSMASERGGPPPPAGLEVFEREEDRGLRVTLSWNHVPGCAGYHVYRSEDIDGGYECVGGISAETMEEYPFFLDDTAEGGHTYHYRVTTLDADDWSEGSMSEPVTAEPERYLRGSSVGKYMVCSIADQRVYCYEDGSVVNIFRCSTGASGTPTGHYHIYAHHRYMGGGNCICEYWMDWKPNYGMHSWPRWWDGYRDYEESLGVTPRSHGCIRLHPLEAYWPYYWAPNGTPLTIVPGSLGLLPAKGCSSSNGAPEPSETWYFAEGFTGAKFVEYLLLFNPGDGPVCATTTYYSETGDVVCENYCLPPGSRQSIMVNLVSGLPLDGHSIKIEADGPIVAQQAEYYEYGRSRGGHISIGAAEASSEWYFADGGTGANTGNVHDAYLLLFNPNEESSATEVTFYVEGADPVVQQFILPPLYRGTTYINAVPGLLGKSVSIEVESKLPVVAQRTSYFSLGSLSNGVNGGECTLGACELAKTWYFAEGCTDHLFDELIVVMNPGDEFANVSAVFFPDTGPYGHRFQVAPRSKATISVDLIPGVDHADVPAMMTSDQDIAVERTMYYARDSRRGGHTSVGASTTSNDWYFAEGYTGSTFDEYILLLNPHEEPTNAELTFFREDGTQIDYSCGLPAQKRITVHVDAIPGLEWAASAVRIHSNDPIVAEQSEYFCLPR